MHSRFESVLYLDADQVPTRDPAYLFDDLPNGAILWPDLENNLGYDCTTLFFDVLGLPSPGNGGDLWSKPRHGYRPVESGQVLIDKRRRWQELLLVDWLADHEDFFYRPPRGKHKWLAYGDKSCFLGGFWRTSLERDGGIDYFTPSNHSMPPDCTWIGNNSGGAFLQRDLAGEIVFAHRCQPTSKLSLHGKNTHPNGFPNAALIDEAIANLRGKWLGRPWDWSDQDGPDNDVARAACGEWVLFRGSETPIKLALQDGGAVNGEWHWTIRHYAKEPYLIVSDKTAGRFLFGNSEGSWCSHDTGTFLYPAPPKDFACPSDIESVSICYGVMSLNEYGLPKHFSGGDVIVDVGAHIGSFAYACHQRGARIIHAVEPDADNFRSLEKNAGGKAKLYRLAAWRSDEPSRWLKLCRPDGAKHSGGGTVVESLTGQEVLAVPFDQIMDIATEHGQRRVTLLKLDCEQSEWPILETSKRLDLVDMIVGEWHGRSADEMLQLLSSRGFQYVGADKHHSAPRLGHFWASRTKRRVVVVSGAASSGNHLHEAILKAAGCIDVRYALPISKDSLPKWSLPVTWLRSVPHGKEATDINALVNMLRDSECEVLAIVPQRRRDVVVKSQLANGHVASRDEAERWCAKADKLSEQFAALGVPCFASQYEELVADPAAHVKRLCEFAGLQVPQINFEIYNGNLKWEVAQNTPSTITA
jgi:FkbM family methyltransferase